MERLRRLILPAWDRFGVVPFGLFCALLFTALPRLDIAITRTFWRDGTFHLGDLGWVRLLYDYGPWPALIVGLGAFLLWLAAMVARRERLLGVRRRVAGYLILVLLFGPGLVVNTLFKDNFGRARPVQVQEFAGERIYTPPLRITDQCERNCSFTSGHAAAGYYFVAFSFVLAGSAATAAFWGGFAFGSLVGLGRVLQGGHFASDVLFSFVAVYLTSALLYYLLFSPRAGPMALTRWLRREDESPRWPCRSGRELCLMTWLPPAVVATAALVIWASGTNQALFLELNALLNRVGSDAFWANVTVLGDALVAFAVALLFVGRHPRLAWSLMIAALIATLWVHGLKEWIGLARPPAVLDPALYHGIGPQYRGRSFPSGHTATIVVLLGVIAFYLRDRRWLWLLLPGAVVVALSRVAVGVHWPLDLLFSMALGWLTAAAAVQLAVRWPGGERWVVQRGLALLFLLCALALPWVDLGYPEARPLQAAIAVVVIVLALPTLGRLLRRAPAARH